MFSDTLTVTINAVPKVLTRISQDGYSSEYLLKETTGEFRLRIRNTSYTDMKRGGVRVDRHNLELIHSIYPVSPATLTTVRKCYTVFECDSSDDLTPVKDTVVGTVAVLSAANVTKMLNWES